MMDERHQAAKRLDRFDHEANIPQKALKSARRETKIVMRQLMLAAEVRHANDKAPRQA